MRRSAMRTGDFLGAAEPESLVVGNTVSFHNLVTGWKSRSHFDPDGAAATGDEFSLDAKCVSRGATTGYDEAAHRKAIEDVRTILSARFGLR